MARRKNNWMPWVIGAAVVGGFFFFRKKDAAAGVTTAHTGAPPPADMVARATSGDVPPEDKAASQAAMTELWYAGVLDAFGNVIAPVEGVTNDESDGMPLAVPGETMQSYTSRAEAWMDATGGMAPMPF